MKYAVIVAGGVGTRMKSSVPKQFLLLNEKPILYHTIQAFQSAIADIKIILVLPEAYLSQQDYLHSLSDNISDIQVVSGGNTRFQSVKNGLNAIQTDGIVFIHDGVRPFISQSLLENCYQTALEKGNAVPCVLIKDSLRKVFSANNEYANREEYRAIQTPQTFQIAQIKNAFEQPYQTSFTDEASVLENMGVEINLIDGMDENIKITNPFDLKIAEIIINQSRII
jgi:2-C-methyl-D-erythritol 4-phosphate cytidylyltransferase